MSHQRLFSFIIALSLFSSAVSTGFASLSYLDGHSDAYNGWSGTATYSNGNLSGTVEYAVFTEADFIANFSGYVPDGPLVYTYLIENTGSDFVSQLVVGIANAASSIGTFDDIGDVDASSASLTSNAVWTFAPSIPSGQSSFGLAFSSPNAPIFATATIVNGGVFASVSDLPTPGEHAVPVPASLIVWGLGLGVTLASKGWRRRR